MTTSTHISRIRLLTRHKNCLRTETSSHESRQATRHTAHQQDSRTSQNKKSPTKGYSSTYQEKDTGFNRRLQRRMTQARPGRPTFSAYFSLVLLALTATNHESNGFLTPTHHPGTRRLPTTSRPVPHLDWMDSPSSSLVTRQSLPSLEAAAGLWEAFVAPANLPVALGLNYAGFTLLKSNLMKKLTTQGYFHSMALGMGVWASLGWKGWTLAVAYLFLGSKGKSLKLSMSNGTARGH